MKKISILLLLLISMRASSENTASGNFINNGICKNNGASVGCLIFVDGLIHGTIVQSAMTNTSVRFCVPDEVTVGQQKAVFLKYMADYPEELHKPAGLLFYLSMMQNFPCKDK